MNKKLSLLLIIVAVVTLPLAAQNTASKSSTEIKPLRSDVGIIGITANFKFLNDFTYKGSSALQDDNGSELEFVLRDVRTISPKLGVGFQILTSFFTGGDKGFGIGSWGLGPVIRAYPFETAAFQPYFQANSLFGNNMALGDLSDSQNGGDGFRVRFGLRGGLVYRIANGLGLFVEVGPDWESGRIFRSDARAWQVNIGIDLYRFN